MRTHGRGVTSRGRRIVHDAASNDGRDRDYSPKGADHTLLSLTSRQHRSFRHWSRPRLTGESQSETQRACSPSGGRGPPRSNRRRVRPAVWAINLPYLSLLHGASCMWSHATQQHTDGALRVLRDAWDISNQILT